jgi:hypothetical protein
MASNNGKNFLKTALELDNYLHSHPLLFPCVGKDLYIQEFCQHMRNSDSIKSGHEPHRYDTAHLQVLHKGPNEPNYATDVKAEECNYSVDVVIFSLLPLCAGRSCLLCNIPLSQETNSWFVKLKTLLYLLHKL